MYHLYVVMATYRYMYYVVPISLVYFIITIIIIGHVQEK